MQKTNLLLPIWDICDCKKLLKKRENNKKICDMFTITSDVSLKRFYFTLSDDGLSLKTLEMAYWFLHSNSSHVTTDVLIVAISTM